MCLKDEKEKAQDYESEKLKSQMELKELNIALAHLKNSNAELRKNSNENDMEIQNLHSRINQKEEKIVALQIKLDGLSLQFSQNKASLDDYIEENNRLKSDLNSFQNEKAQLNIFEKTLEESLGRKNELIKLTEDYEDVRIYLQQTVNVQSTEKLCDILKKGDLIKIDAFYPSDSSFFVEMVWVISRLRKSHIENMASKMHVAERSVQTISLPKENINKLVAPDSNRVQLELARLNKQFNAERIAMGDELNNFKIKYDQLMNELKIVNVEKETYQRKLESTEKSFMELYERSAFAYRRYIDDHSKITEQLKRLEDEKQSQLVVSNTMKFHNIQLMDRLKLANNRFDGISGLMADKSKAHQTILTKFEAQSKLYENALEELQTYKAQIFEAKDKITNLWKSNEAYKLALEQEKASKEGCIIKEKVELGKVKKHLQQQIDNLKYLLKNARDEPSSDLPQLRAPTEYLKPLVINASQKHNNEDLTVVNLKPSMQ